MKMGKGGGTKNLLEWFGVQSFSHMVGEVNMRTSLKATAVALGTFDGLHLGHMAVIKSAVSYANGHMLSPCVLLFDSHPLQHLTGETPPILITPENRERFLLNNGIQPYTVNFMDIKDLTAEEFVEKVLVDKMCAKAIVCGYNYRFGKDAKGDIYQLSKICDQYSIDLIIADEVDYAGKPVSSTRIRQALEQGDIEKANSMLGREFSYNFTVVGGDKRGRLLGAPTINQVFWDGFVRPKFGVYASKSFVGGKWHASVTNFGMRPTVGTDIPRSETCIMDFSGDLYGQNIEVALLEYLRPEIKFNSLEELGAQIKEDANNAEQVFSSYKEFAII